MQALRHASFRYDSRSCYSCVTSGPGATPIQLVLVDLASVLFGMPLRQAGLIWSFAPALVPLRLPVVPLAGQLIDGDLDHLRPVAGEG